MRRQRQNRKRNYQNKRVRRGEPSARYREMHPFPTTKVEFGTPQFYSLDGRWQLRMADGAMREQMVNRGAITRPGWGSNPAVAPTTSGGTQLMHYRLPRQKNTDGRRPEKKVPQPGTRMQFVHTSTGMVYSGEVFRRSGSYYRVTNTGTVVLTNVVPTGLPVTRDEVDAMERNATAAMVRKMRRTLK